MSTPDWFNNRVLSGIQYLYVLSLQGAPAAEVVPMTANAWIATLWAAPVAWNESLDTARMGEAFLTLAGKSDRWPSPRAFMEAMAPRPPPLALPPPPPRPAPPAAKARLVELMASLVAKMTRTAP